MRKLTMGVLLMALTAVLFTGCRDGRYPQGTTGTVPTVTNPLMPSTHATTPTTHATTPTTHATAPSTHATAPSTHTTEPSVTESRSTDTTGNPGGTDNGSPRRRSNPGY